MSSKKSKLAIFVASTLTGPVWATSFKISIPWSSQHNYFRKWDICILQGSFIKLLQYMNVVKSSKQSKNQCPVTRQGCFKALKNRYGQEGRMQDQFVQPIMNDDLNHWDLNRTIWVNQYNIRIWTHWRIIGSKQNMGMRNTLNRI